MLKIPDEDIVAAIAAAFGLPASSVTDPARLEVARCIATAISRQQQPQTVAGQVADAHQPVTGRLLVYVHSDQVDVALDRAIARMGCELMICRSLDEFQEQLRSGNFARVLVAPASVLRPLVAPSQDDSELSLTLAEVQERHIRQTLASTFGNKTRAARLLHIDPKTLYTKLKSYAKADQ